MVNSLRCNMRYGKTRAQAAFLAVALVLGLMGRAAAQGAAEAPVKADTPAGQAQLTWQKFPVEFADYYCTQGMPIIYFDTKPDFCRSDNALLVDVSQSRFGTTMVIDASGGTGSDYDTLYVDLNRDGKYTDDPVYKAEPFKGQRGPDRQPVRAYFADVAVPRPSVPGARPRVQVFLGPDNCSIIPQKWAVGSLNLGGRKMPMALVDTNWDGNVAAVGGRSPGLARDMIPQADYLILGINGEKELRPPTPESFDSLFIPGEGGSARGFLTRHLVLDDGTYELKAEQLSGGASLQLVPAQMPTGTLKLTSEPTRSHVLLIGTSTCVIRSGNPKEMAVPDDTYLFMNRTYSTNEFTVKQGEQTEVDPQEMRRPVSRRTRTEPPVATAPAAPEPTDAWTIYVQQFIVTYKLDMSQRVQAFSILKDLKARAQEYRTSHKAEYEAAGKIADKAERDSRQQALDGPVNQIFEELKTRLAAIPTDVQWAAVSPASQRSRATSTQPAAAGKKIRP